MMQTNRYSEENQTDTDRQTGRYRKNILTSTETETYIQFQFVHHADRIKRQIYTEVYRDRQTGRQAQGGKESSTDKFRRAGKQIQSQLGRWIQRQTGRHILVTDLATLSQRQTGRQTLVVDPETLSQP